MKKLLFILSILLVSNLFADIAKIVALKGEATIYRNGETIEINRNSVLKEKDIIKTKDNSKIQILFKDETIISIGKNSEFVIDDYSFENKDNVKAEFSMVKGVFRTITGKIGKISPENFNLKTKSASIGIRGTQIVTDISDTKERIFCTEGQIEVIQNISNLKIIVNEGEFISMENNFGDKLQKDKTKEKDIDNLNKNISVAQNEAIDDITNNNNNNNNNNIEKQIDPNTNILTNNISEQKSSIIENTNIDTPQTKQQALIDAELEAKKLAEEKELAEKELAEKQVIAQKNADEARIATEQALSVHALALAEQNRITEAQEKAEQEASLVEQERIAAEQAAAKQAATLAVEAKNVVEQAMAAQVAALSEQERIIAEQEASAKAAALAKQERIIAEQIVAAQVAALVEKAKNTAEQAAAAHAAAQTQDEIDSAKIALEQAVAAQSAALAEQERIATEQAIAAQSAALAEQERIATEQAATTKAIALAEEKKIATEQALASLAKAKAEQEKIAKEQALAAQAAALAEQERVTKEQIAANLAKKKAEQATVALAAAQIIEEAAQVAKNLTKVTPDIYFINNISKASYLGNFNNTSFNDKKQYLDKNKIKSEIPQNTTISMDIDFGLKKDQISNGIIDLNNIGDGTSRALTFNGDIDTKKSTFKLNATDFTKGKGDGTFYGSEANLMQGNLDMETKDKIQIKGNFDATKQ
jgi:hypothetical protein